MNVGDLLKSYRHCLGSERARVQLQTSLPHRNGKAPNGHVAFGADRETFCDVLEHSLARGPKIKVA